MANQSYKVLILGAGAAGISVAAKLSQSLEKGSIAIVEPSEKHYYQPLWSIAGTGLIRKETTERRQQDLIPEGVTWIKEAVQSIDPESQQVQLTNNLSVGYDFLIVATGLVLNWEKIEGLPGQLGRNGICSVYQYDQVDYAAEQIQNFRGGTALFVMPPPPIKCAGAPQKVMYMAEHIFKENGVRDKSKIIFATAGKAMFGLPLFSDALAKLVKEKNIEPLFQHKIVAVNAEKKEALFSVTHSDDSSHKVAIPFDLLHVVPPMSAHSFIQNSSLAFTEGDQKGWLAVDKHTLQHLQYPNIFGIGDVTGIPNSKTGAAVRAQYPIVAKNLLAVMKGQNPTEKYNGYSSCPLITEIGKVMLAEFGYDNKLLPTFPLDPSVPRRSYWHLKKNLLPYLYWYGMLKGRG